MTFRKTASEVITTLTHRALAYRDMPGSVVEPCVRTKHSASLPKVMVLALAIALYACGGASEAPKDGGPPKGTATKLASTNPWGGFKVGSFVKTKTTVSAQMMGRTTDTTTEMKTTLAELTADKAVLDIETTVMGNTTKTRTEVPLTSAVQTGTTAVSQAQNPTTGTDTVVVAGKSLDCKTMEVEIDSGGSKVKTKTWTSDQIPGFLVKSISTSTGAMTSTTTMEAVDFKAN
jgi:hypothetical protein